jgi:DNA-binding transcriptional ArsR family regulator
VTPQKKKRPVNSGKAQKEPGQADSLTLTDLEQVRVLADPLRIRILEQLCDEERTTKQVAQRLGEKPTKLYHHVEALERIGLIRLARTRQNRGTVEKYYIAVARQFKTDSRIFSIADADSAEGDAMRSVISTIFDRTAEEMRGLVAHAHGEQGIEEQAVLSHLEIRTGAREGRKLQAQLMKLIKSLENGGEEGEKPGARRYRFTLAFFPLDRE